MYVSYSLGNKSSSMVCTSRTVEQELSQTYREIGTVPDMRYQHWENTVGNKNSSWYFLNTLGNRNSFRYLLNIMGERNSFRYVLNTQGNRNIFRYLLCTLENRKSSRHTGKQ
jgi:hypothetical protein